MEAPAGCADAGPALGLCLSCWHEQGCRAQQRTGRSWDIDHLERSVEMRSEADSGPSNSDLGLAKADLYRLTLVQLSAKLLLLGQGLDKGGIYCLHPCARLIPSLCTEIRIFKLYKTSSFSPWVPPSRWSYVPYCKC